MYGLNDAMEIANGDVIIVFDADYTPSTGLVRKLAMAFIDPTVGAVMGRVIPRNATKNRLTSFQNLERIGGYQVDMQARYNLGLITQYGGTVGGFRKDFIMESGGFNTRVLAEDTELTMRMYTSGYRVVYDNSAECYEEVPETWKVRGKQIRRWSRGHNAVMFRYFGKTILSRYLNFWQKVDGCLFLACYLVPFLFVLGMGASLALFFLNEMNLANSWLMLIFIGIYNTYGNAYEAGADKVIKDLTAAKMSDEGVMIDGDMISKKNLTVGKSCYVLGDIPTERNIELEDGSVVFGNVISQKSIIIGSGCHVKGNVFAQECVEIHENVTIGTEGQIKSVIAGDAVSILGNSTVYGRIRAKRKGKVNKNPQ